MSKHHWISFPRVEGVAPRQAHTDLPQNTFERELGRGGFYGPAAHMVHTHPPTGWTHIEGPLRPRAFDLNHIETPQVSPWDATSFLSNKDTKLRIWTTAAPMDHLVRNSDGDELLFVHQGRGALFCDYGRLEFSEGDYVVLPRGTLWRLEPEDKTTLLLIEATGSAYQLPDKGVVGQHAIFDPAVLRTPAIDSAFKAQQGNTTWMVQVKRRNQLSTISYPFNPLDAVGWQGNLAPVALNWRDIRPLMSHRYHVPPSAHTTFVARGFVVCTFCPRPIESDPGALKVPFFHGNEDFDEVIFYHRGEFFSRDNIHPGMVTLHPSGVTHGPHPQALQTGAEHRRTMTDEVAVMVDTVDALDVDPIPEGIEFTDYVNSWKAPTKDRQ